MRRLLLLAVANLLVLGGGVTYAAERPSRTPHFVTGGRSVMNDLYAAQPYTVVQFLVSGSGSVPHGSEVTAIDLVGASPGLQVHVDAMAPEEDRVANQVGFPGDPRARLGKVLRPVAGLPLVAAEHAVTRVFVTLTAPQIGTYALTGLRVHWSNGVYRGENLVGMALVLHVTHPGPYVPDAWEKRCNQYLSGYLGQYGEAPGCLEG